MRTKAENETVFGTSRDDFATKWKGEEAGWFESSRRLTSVSRTLDEASAQRFASLIFEN